MAIQYGYARVSSQDQKLDRQIDALREFGVRDTNVYVDKASGKDFQRPAYQRLKRRLKEGDVLVVKSIDRLGRNYDEILDEWRFFTREKKASMVVLDMPLLDTRVSRNGLSDVLIADIVLELLSYVAQIERENIKQRQAEGIAAAKARGVQFGRPRIDLPDNFEELAESFRRGSISCRKAAQTLGVSPSTFYRRVREELIE